MIDQNGAEGETSPTSNTRKQGDLGRFATVSRVPKLLGVMGLLLLVLLGGLYLGRNALLRGLVGDELARAGIKLEGADSLSLAPTLDRVSLQDLRLIEGLLPKDLNANLAIERIDLDFDLWALLSGDVRIEELIIKGPRVRLDLDALAVLSDQTQEMTSDKGTESANPVSPRFDTIVIEDVALTLVQGGRSFDLALDAEARGLELSAATIVVGTVISDLRAASGRGRISLAIKDPQAAQIKADLEDLDIAAFSQFMGQGDALAGQLYLDLTADVTGGLAAPKILAKGEARLAKAALRRPAEALTVADVSVLLDRLAIDTEAMTPEVDLSRVELQELFISLAHGDGATDSLTVDQVETGQMMVADGAVSIASVGLKGFMLKESDAQAITLDAASLAPSRLSEGEVEIGALALSNPDLTVVRSGDGSINLLDIIDRAMAHVPTSPDDTATKATHLLFAGASVADKAHARVVNLNPKKPSEVDLYLDHLSVGAYDSADPKAITPFALDGKIGTFSTLDGKGHIVIDDTGLTGLDLDLELHDFELTRLSGYTAESLGFRIDQGQGDVELTLQVEPYYPHPMTGLARIHLTKFRAQNVKAADGQTMGERLDIPFETGLSLLRDGKGHTDLEIPIAGSLDAPDFDASQVINRAISRAINKATVGVVKSVFKGLTSPVRGLVKLAGGGKSLSLPPVIFVPGSSALAAGAATPLDEIGELLERKEKLFAQACAVITPADKSAVAAASQSDTAPADEGQILRAITALANERIKRVKAVLLADHKITNDRVSECPLDLNKTRKDAPLEPAITFTILK